MHHCKPSFTSLIMAFFNSLSIFKMATLKSLLVKSVIWLFTQFLLLVPHPHYLQAILTCLFVHLDILDMILLQLLALVNPSCRLCELVNFIYLFIYLMTGWITVPHPTSIVRILCAHFQWAQP